MRTVSAAEVDRTLDTGALVDRLEQMFAQGCEQPPRHHHTVQAGADPDGTLLLMPAWRPGGRIGIKIATIFAANGGRGLPSVMASYVLLDATSGEPLAVIDGAMLTVRRTAAASALAARFLARADASRLVMVGAGALAPHLIRAHASQRPIAEVAIWNHRPARAVALAADLRAAWPEGPAIRATEDLEAAVREADIIACATLSAEPLIAGRWLKAGAHLDLVGAYTPEMRESDDDCVRRARVFVDTRAGATREGGDIAQPLAAGVLREADILADLHELARGQHGGRASDGEITLFKSVGAALEDLAAAELVVEQL